MSHKNKTKVSYAGECDIEFSAAQLERFGSIHHKTVPHCKGEKERAFHHNVVLISKGTHA